MGLQNKLAGLALAATAFTASAGELTTVPSVTIRNPLGGNFTTLVTPRGNVITMNNKLVTSETCKSFAASVSGFAGGVDDLEKFYQNPENVKAAREIPDLVQGLSDFAEDAFKSYSFAAKQCADYKAISPKVADDASQFVEKQSTRLQTVLHNVLK